MDNFSVNKDLSMPHTPMQGDPYQRCRTQQCYLPLYYRSLSLFFLLLIGACSQIQTTTSPKPKVKPKPPHTSVAAVEKPQEIIWGWQPQAVQLSITADRNLNRYDQQPHALMLCLYQLSSATVFSEFSKTSSGISTLLQCGPFDSSVVQSERLFVQPGEQYTLDLDRWEKARYLAFVAGYARADALRISPIFTFPSVHYTKGALFWKKDQYLPSELTVNLVLTEHALQSINPQ